MLIMKIKLLYDRGEKIIEVDKDAKVREILVRAGINTETVIVKKDGNIITEEEELKTGDVIEAVRIISGG
ncbi:sulfur carrier protein ThiS [archaeon]|nr:sulfur carrier protein ThiS [archaeon]